MGYGCFVPNIHRLCKAESGLMLAFTEHLPRPTWPLGLVAVVGPNQAQPQSALAPFATAAVLIRDVLTCLAWASSHDLDSPSPMK